MAGTGISQNFPSSESAYSQDGNASFEPGLAGQPEEREEWLSRNDALRVLFVAVAAAFFWVRGANSAHLVLLGVAVALAGAYPIFREAFANIAERRMTMELSMAIAILAALAIREIFTALIITLFVLVAEILEALTVGRGRRAIQQLVDLLPGTAVVRRSGEWKEVGIREIVPSDVVLVKPGARIPVDGTVTGGHSFVDQATITGESMPVERRPCGQVYAGTINQTGSLEIRVERLGRDTTFGKIIEAVERAERSRAPIQRIADRLAGYLVYFALAAAALTYLVTQNARSTISVVIVAGACGIAAGTPLAILGAIGRAAQSGVIIKGGVYLERLAEIDTVLLDKTGTLTYGAPEVLEILPAPGFAATDLLQAAATAESHSEHPVARAILRKTAELGLPLAEPERFDYIPGKGVIAVSQGDEIVVGTPLWLLERQVNLAAAQRSSGESQILISRRGQFLGGLVVADTLRPEAKQAIQSLKDMRLRTVLLTGDARNVGEDIGRQLGVDEVLSELLPQDKLQYVSELGRHQHSAAMVGDGVNDAPALVQAAVGVAMGSGTDVARESADVVLIGSDLSKLVETLRIARNCRRIIMQNFVGTLVVDGCGVGLAALGFLNPLLAAFIHVSSEMAFILNSSRLLPRASPLGRQSLGHALRSHTEVK